MEQIPEHVAAVIADEIAEHLRGKCPVGEDYDVTKSRLESLLPTVRTVLRALRKFALVDSVQDLSVTNSQVCIYFRPLMFSTAALYVRVQHDGLSFFPFQQGKVEEEDPHFTADLFWNPHHRQWFGPRVERDLSAPGAPWIRESAEAEITRAVLKAITEAVVRVDS